MRKQFHQYEVVRIVDPPACDAVEVLQAVLGVRPQPALESIRGSIAVPHLANVVSCIVVEPEDRVLPSSSGILTDNSRRLSLRFLVVKHENVAPLLFLVIDQWEDIGLPEHGKGGVVEDRADTRFAGDLALFPFETGEHLEIVVRRQLKWAVTIGFQADGELGLGNLVDDLDVLLVRLGTIQVLSDVDGSEIVHVLVDELSDSYLSKVAVRLVPD